MELLYKITLPIHVAAGFIGLVLFWLPIFVKKGAKLHVKIGWGYVFAMWTVIVTAAVMSMISLIDGHYFIALFLGFLTLITIEPLWYGISILKFKKGVNKAMYNKRRTLQAVIIVYSLINIVFALQGGVHDGDVLLLIFAGLGLTNIKSVRLSFEEYRQQVNPIKDHILGMLTTGIASYTAFFAFGGRTWLGELLSGQLMIIPWVAPTVIGLIGIKWYTQRYTQQKRKVAVG